MSGIQVLAGPAEEERYLLTKKLDKKPYLVDFPTTVGFTNHTKVENTGGILLSSHAPSTEKSMLLQPLTTHENFQADIAFRMNLTIHPTENYWACGFVLRNPAINEFRCFYKWASNKLACHWYGNLADSEHNLFEVLESDCYILSRMQIYTYLRLVADGTNRKFYVSSDGVLFTQLNYSESITFGNNTNPFTPTQIGIFFRSWSMDSRDIQAHILHYEVTY